MFMTGAQACEDVKPGSSRRIPTQRSDSSKALKQSDESSAHASEPRKKKKKKKIPENSNASSKNSKVGDTKTSKKRKTPKSGNETSGNADTGREVEVQAQVQNKALQRKVHVKQRSFSTLLDTGSSTIAISDSTRDADAAALIVDETGGFATGSYGLLLETKRAEKLCLSLALQKRHVEAMFRAFKREEQLGTGDITTGEFLSMLNEQPRQLTKGLFEAVGLARDLRRLRFDDFVVCIATIATWSKSELLHYAFNQFDVDESGVMDARELRAFCEGLKNDSSFYFAKNVNIAREKLVLRDRNTNYRHNKDTSSQAQIENNIEANALMDLKDLAKGSTEFQVAFYPLLQLQQNVRACAPGERVWAKVAQQRQEIEVIVHYMRIHNGKLPSFSISKKITAYLLPYSEANSQLVVQRLAVLKFAEEERIWQEQAHARAEDEKLALAQIQEEDQPKPAPKNDGLI